MPSAILDDVPVLDRLARLFRRPDREAPVLGPKALLPSAEPTPETLPLFDWPQERIREMLLEFLDGKFDLAEDFYENIRRDGRIFDGVRKRGDAIRRLPEEWTVNAEAPDSIKAATERLRQSWADHCLTKSDKSDITRRLALFGFCLVHRRYAFKGGTLAPVLTPWVHRGVAWDDSKRAFRVTMRDGTQQWVPLTGSDEFLVISSGGDRPWTNGAILPLGKLFLLLNQGWDRWAQYNDVQALAIRVLKTPYISRESLESGEAYDYVRRLRAGDTWLNPRERGGQEGYDLSLLESKNPDAYKTFLDMLKNIWTIVAIVLLGHNLSQEVKGGSLAATEAAVDVTRDVMMADAEAVDAGLRPLFLEWLLANFRPATLEELPEPAEAYAPRYRHCTEEPADEKAEAETHSANATTLKTYVESADTAGVDMESIGIDWRAAATWCGIPLLEMAKGTKAKYLPAPAPQPGGADAGALLSGRGPRRVLLLGGRESETEGDSRVLVAAQDYTDRLSAAFWELHAALLAAVDDAADYPQLRAGLAGAYRDTKPDNFTKRLAEQLALAELAGYLSIVEGYPVIVQPLLMNAGTGWSVPSIVDRAVGWFRRKVEAVTSIPVEYEIGAKPAQRAPDLARGTALDTTARLVRHAERQAEKALPLEETKAELRQVLEDLGLSAGGSPLTEALPVREDLQSSFARTRVEILSVDFYRAAFPGWQYDSVLDDRTTEGCRELNGLVMPAKDPRWVGLVPPRHWRCRAHIRAVVDSALARAEKKEPPPGFGGEGTFGTLREEWEPRPGSYPEDLWEIYANSAGVAEPHIEIPGPWWRKKKADAAAG